MINTIKKILTFFNLEINRRPISVTKKRQWLQDFDFKTILDIGANQGYFAKEMREMFPKAFIHCFEPLPDCFNQLLRNTQKDNLILCYPVGLGNQSEILTMYQNDYSPSSSLLEMTDLHIRNFPQTEHTRPQQVAIQRLDDLLKDTTLQAPILVKIDVQGFEDKVIEGGQLILKQADALLIEMSFVPLYHEQLLFHDIYGLLTDLGFEFRGAYHQLFDDKDGSVLQIDGIFINKKSATR
ncbi:MAG: FkbM family methyltransferase [Spirosomataceae bacterium]